MLFGEKRDVDRVVLEPSYVAGFSCDGEACGSLCCRFWGAVVDEDTLSRYRNAGGALGEELRAAIVRESASGAWVIRQKEGSCLFLQKDGLCSLQKRFGAVALSDVCAEYPRRTLLAGECAERTLCMTCPVAERLALLPKEPMTFRQCLEPLDRPHYYQRVEMAPELRETFPLLRNACVFILQERSLSLDDRIVALGLFLSDISRELDLWELEERESQIVRLASQAILKAGEVRAKFPFDEEASLTFFAQLLPYLARVREDKHPLTRMYVTQIHAIFGDGTGEEMLRSFRERRVAYEENVLGTGTHILENFLVQELWAGPYLSREGQDSMAGYEALVLLAKLMKLLVLTDVRVLVSPETEEAYGEEPTPSQQAVLDAIRYLAIQMNHTEGFGEALLASLHDLGTDNRFYEIVML